MLTRSSALLLGAVCACLAVFVSGCGSVSSIVDPLAKAADVSTKAPGFKATFNMQMSSSSLPINITMTGTGSFDTRDQAGSMGMDMQLPNLPQARAALGGGAAHFDEIIDKHVLYMRMPSAMTSKLPGGRPWVKLDISKALTGAGLSSLMSSPMSSDPSQMLQYLRAVSGGVTTIGTETVDGQTTTHYRATIDISKVADRAPVSNKSALKAAIGQLQSLAKFKQIPVDVWVDGSNLVRRLTEHIQVSVMSTSMTMTMTMDIPEYGSQPMPALPAADQVTDLSSLLNGAPAGTLSGPASGG